MSLFLIPAVLFVAIWATPSPAQASPRGLDFERNGGVGGWEIISFRPARADRDSCYDLLGNDGSIVAAICRAEGGLIFWGEGKWEYDTAGRIEMEVPTSRKVSLVYHHRRTDEERNKIYNGTEGLGSGRTVDLERVVEVIRDSFSNAGGDPGQIGDVHVRGGEDMEFVIMGEEGQACLATGKMDRDGEQVASLVLP